MTALADALRPAAPAAPAALPPGTPPVLTVVVDTEEEFDWSRPLDRGNTAVTAIAEQPRLHDAVYGPLGLVPTYVIDWPVATTAASVRVLRRLQEAGACAIGAHLHPWVTPPHEEPVDPWHSYHGNLPEALERAKLARLTDAITARFGRPPRVFKAGRYGLGPNTPAMLAELGYRVDASVVPHTAFTADGGPDYRRFGPDPWWIRTAGGRHLLELPVTTGFAGLLGRRGEGLFGRVNTPAGVRLRLPGVLARGGVVERIRLTPEGATLAEMQRLTRALLRQGTRVFSLTYHSPSLKPDCTPYVRDTAERDAFIATIGAYARWFRDEVGGLFRMAEELHGLCAGATARARPAAE